MSRYPGRWLTIAVLFAVLNAGGGGFALAEGEGMHAGVHGALTLLGLVVAAWAASFMARKAELPLRLPEQRLQQLQESVDAIAIEVERIGEAQRFEALHHADLRPPVSP